MAAIETLTDKAIQAAIKAAKASGKKQPLNDGGGLYIQVQPTGVGWWRLRYWIDSQEKRISLGTYPTVSLAKARELRRENQKLKANGVDPSQAKKAAKAARKAKAAATRAQERGEALPGTFEAVAREWLQQVHEVKVSAGHARTTRTRFERDVFPWIGSRDLASIEAPELLTVLRRVTARKAIETAHRIKDACGQVFRYGIACGHCVRNPAADLKDALPPVPARHHAAIVSPAEVGALLRDMDGYAGSLVTRVALQLSALLFLRPGELRQMEWAWVDLDEALLTIPPEVMKRTKADKLNGPPHLVPLAPQALAALRELQPLTGRGRYVFPGVGKTDRCMSDNTVRSALRRLGYENEDMTAHGFRAMARTMAAERLDIAVEVIEAQLGHAVADSLGRAYNRTQYLSQRRELMNRWANYLDELRLGTEGERQ